MTDDRCLNCNEPVRTINYALGRMLLHVDPNASFPSEQKGTAWLHCKQRVATLPPKPVDGRTDPCPAPGYAGRHTAVGVGAISSPYVCHGCGTFFVLPDNEPDEQTLSEQAVDAIAGLIETDAQLRGGERDADA